MYLLLIRKFCNIIYLLHGGLHCIFLSDSCLTCKSFWLNTKGCLLSIPDFGYNIYFQNVFVLNFLFS